MCWIFHVFGVQVPLVSLVFEKEAQRLLKYTTASNLSLNTRQPRYKSHSMIRCVCGVSWRCEVCQSRCEEMVFPEVSPSGRHRHEYCWWGNTPEPGPPWGRQEQVERQRKRGRGSEKAHISKQRHVHRTKCVLARSEPRSITTHSWLVLTNVT